MCILFLHVDPTHPRYVFIIASNRDEFLDRPTEVVQQWSDYPEIFAGRDAEHGRGGGTWIGITKTGRFATLTNYRISMKDFKMDAKGRGHLVTDYLTGSSSPDGYCSDVHSTCDQYNGFNLLAGNVWGGPAESRKIHYISNVEHKPCLHVEPGIHGLSNRLLNSPWGKVVQGKALFTDSMKAALSSEEFSEDSLIADLLQLLLTKDQHHPDPHIQPTEHSEEVLRKWSSIFVRQMLDGHDYGTRTRSVILVRSDGTASYVESTLDPNTSSWNTKRLDFNMQM